MSHPGSHGWAPSLLCALLAGLFAGTSSGSGGHQGGVGEHHHHTFGLGSARLHPHGHTLRHPAPAPPDLVEQTRAQPAPGVVQRALERGTDIDEEHRGQWPPLPEFYQPGRVVKQAVQMVEEMDPSLYWLRWKKGLLDLYFDSSARSEEGRPLTTSATCSRSTDCEDRCRERCLLDKVRHACTSGACSGTCQQRSNSCDSWRWHCQYGCTSECLPKCIKENLHRLKNELLACVPRMLRKCLPQCHAMKPREGKLKAKLTCSTQCVSKANLECLREPFGQCSERCGRHVCLRGHCQCPAMLSGHDECLEKPSLEAAGELPELSQHCFQTFHDPAFQLQDGSAMPQARDRHILDDRSRSTMQSYSQYLRWASQMSAPATLVGPDLSNMADWTSCALIGSSGSLTGQGMGEFIDKGHTAWIRFNDAPTIGYETDVGARTTLRIQNNLYCGFNEGKEEICGPYTKFAVRAKCHSTQGRECPVMSFSNAVHSSVHDFMQPEFYHSPQIDVNDYHWNTTGHVDTSAGFFGALLALHLCGEVHIYGFDQHPTHYYQKKASATKKEFETRHGWDAERHCLRTYQQVFPSFRLLQAHELSARKDLLQSRSGRL